VVELSEI